MYVEVSRRGSQQFERESTSMARSFAPVSRDMFVATIQRLPMKRHKSLDVSFIGIISYDGTQSNLLCLY